MENNTFVSIQSFMTLHLINDIPVKRNRDTNKLFATVDGEPMKVQQSIDGSKPMTILVKEKGSASKIDDCCLINYDPTKGAETVFTVK